MVKSLRIFVAAAAAGACVLSAAAADELPEAVEAALEGYERTGETRVCIGIRSIRDIDAIDDEYFLVETTGGQLYLNEVNGRCMGASRTTNRLQYTTSQSNLCSNEIIRVVDNFTGFTAGSCGLGEFELLEPVPEEDVADDDESSDEE